MCLRGIIKASHGIYGHEPRERETEREHAGKRAKLIDAIVNEFTLVNAECAYRNDLTFSKGNGRAGYCLCQPVSVCVCQCLC